MSTIETKTLQADKLLAKDGTEATEVSIPSMSKKLALAYATVPSGKIANSINISSLIVGSKNFTFNLLQEQPDKHYCLVGMRNGNYTSGHDFNIEVDYTGVTTKQFVIICKSKGNAVTGVNSFNVLLFRNDMTD